MLQLVMVPLNEIKIKPERQRQGLGDDEKQAKRAFEDLQQSMASATGLIHPIRVNPDMVLQAGFRRLKAAEALGWTEIPCTISDSVLTSFDEERLELEENLSRFDLSWHEREMAIARVDRIRKHEDPSWTQQRTAQELGVTQSTVSEALMMEKALLAFPELKKASTRKQAMSQAKQKSKTILRKVEVASNPAIYRSVTERVINGKAEEVIEQMADGSAGRLILTDGPFGIDYDKRPAGSGPHESYEDSPESYRERTKRMAPHLFRVLPEDGFLVWFLAHDHFEWTKVQFRKAGFVVDPVPLVWDRTEGRAYSQRPDRWFGKAYDIALHCIKGNPEMVVRSRDKGVKGKGNVFRHKPVEVKEKEHIVERPIELYADLISCMTVYGEQVTDFFGGSGKVAAAAASLRRNHMTVEMNPNHIPTIINNIFQNTPQEQVKIEDLLKAASNGKE